MTVKKLKKLEDMIKPILKEQLATVYRELTRGGTGELDKNGRSGYSAALGQKRVSENFKRRGRRAANK